MKMCTWSRREISQNFSFTYHEIRNKAWMTIFFFLPLQMKLGHIYYMHDSTESTEDSFTLSASAYEIERRSLPFTISVTVIPVNDEPPKLTRNTGLEVAFFFPLLTRTCSVTLIFKFSKKKKGCFFSSWWFFNYNHLKVKSSPTWVTI